MGLAVLTGGLAFVGGAGATELVVDGSFENTTPSNSAIVRVGGKTGPGVGQGWSTYSTYLYSTQYTMPGPTGCGAAFLRPYPSGVAGITKSSATVAQTVSLTGPGALTAAAIDAGTGKFTASAWFSSYLTQGDYSDLKVQFENANQVAVGDPVALGGQAFVAALPTGSNSKYPNADFWGQDSQTGAIPAGARFAAITIHATALAGSPDGYVDLVSLDVENSAASAPIVSAADPGNNAVGVNPPITLSLTLQDRATAVDTNSIRLVLDGAPVTPQITKPDTNTYVTYAAGVLPALSTHTYTLRFGDTGAPATIQTNSYTFSVADYLTLPAALASPLGSEATNQPGFALRVYQVNPLSIDLTAVETDLPSSISFDEAVLAGLVAPNVADLSAASSGNLFSVPGVVNWANSTGVTADFPTSTPFPGIPGTNGLEDDFVDELITYVRFPAAGFYQMGINNNDAFRLTAAGGGVQRLQILGATNYVIPSVAIATNISQLQFGGALPTTPLVAPIVYATPTGNPDAGCTLSAATNLVGKIALVDRGSSLCSSAFEAQQAQDAGAVAVIETTPGDEGFPFRLGDINTAVHIPVLEIADAYGGAALKAALSAGQPVSASIQGDPNVVVAEWDGPKGFGPVDVLFGFAVPQPGDYPFRLVADHALLAADLEWFTVQPDGTRILLNDTGTAGALLAFQAVAAPPKLNPPTLAGGKLTLSWTGAGLLQESLSPAGPFTTSANQANPQSPALTGAVRFYRVFQP